MFKAPAKFSLVHSDEVNSSGMAVCADTFRRPKGKGGTRLSPTSDVSTLRIEDSQVAGVSGSNATAERFSNQRIRDRKFPNTATCEANGRGRRRRRTAEDFLTFCKMVLDYENYEDVKEQDIRRRNSCSPLGSTGSSNESWVPSKEDDSYFREKNSSEENDYAETVGNAAVGGDVEYADEGWDTVTCFCGKPFAGRPMIECSGCYTWIHIKCGRLKRTHIPDIWYCAKCREKDPSLTSSNFTKQKKMDNKSICSVSELSSLSSPQPDFKISPNKTENFESKASNLCANGKVTGSRKRKISATPKVQTHKASTKASAASLSKENSREENFNMNRFPALAFSDKQSTSSPPLCPPGSSSMPQSDSVEKRSYDSGLESASVSPVSSPRQSEEETDSASSSGSGQLMPPKRSAKKKKLLPSKNNRKRSISDTR